MRKQSQVECLAEQIKDALSLKHLPKLITYHTNGINYTFQQRESGMRDPDIVAANIQPEERSDRLDKNTNWMETPIQLKKGSRRYVVGKKKPKSVKKEK